MERPVDPTSWKPKYVQVAADLRGRIRSGEYVAGQALPSESDIGIIYNVSRQTARHALDVLDRERLILRERGVLARVRELGERSTMRLERGDRQIVRQATPAERQKWELGEYEPVAEITKADGTVKTVPAYEVEFIVDQED